MGSKRVDIKPICFPIFSFSFTYTFIRLVSVEVVVLMVMSGSGEVAAGSFLSI